MILFLIKDGDRAIHIAVSNGDPEVVKLLVDNSADINSSNYKKITPLAVACKLQDWQMVNLLLDLKVSSAGWFVECCLLENNTRRVAR